MTRPLGVGMALAPLRDQRVPGCLGRSPNVRHPASGLHDPASCPDAPFAAFVVAHPLHAPAEVPAARGDLPEPPVPLRPVGDDHGPVGTVEPAPPDLAVQAPREIRGSWPPDGAAALSTGQLKLSPRRSPGPAPRPCR